MKTLRPGEVLVDDDLPALEIPITATLIVAGALASRDFQDVHHDAEVAKTGGATDLFMNILTTSGLVGRFVTDWTGPEALIRRLSIRLGAPNYPHDTLTLTGRVALVDGNHITIEVRGANSLGDHVTGTVEVTLP